jgi:glycosyltransferase involved in cell wall biosynthesis
VANADALRVVKPLLGPATFHNRLNIGCWAWELSRFPGEWRDRFQGLREVWVLSAFMQQAIGAVAPVPVVTIGSPVVPYPPTGLTRADLGLPADQRVFLFAFDMLSVPERKNPLDCIAAYRMAFAPRFDGVQLVIKANHLAQFPDWQARLRDEVASARGILIEDTLERRAVNALYEQADVYVSLHRSEGFGLTLAESMRLGKPVIATDYSANRDYLNESNGFPVRYTLVELERDYGPYRAGNVWAQPDIAHAAALMRQAAGDPEEARRRGLRAAADMERLYSPRAVARRMIERLRAG